MPIYANKLVQDAKYEKWIKEVNKMKLQDLKIEYDKLQIKYGAKELDSIYNGGCSNNPDKRL